MCPHDWRDQECLYWPLRMRKLTLHTLQIAILGIVWAVVHSLLFWRYGIRPLFDAAGYVQGADFLIENGRFEDFHHVFYAVPISLLAFFRWVFTDQLLPFLIFQCLLSGLATVALYCSGNRLFQNQWAGFLSALLFLIWWDNIHWNVVTMTESLLCSCTCFLMYFLIHFEGKRKQYYLLASLMILIFFIRPTGIVIILGTIAFFLQYHWEALVASPVRKYGIICLCLALAYAGAALMFTHWDFTDQYKRGNIVTYMDTIDGKSLYHGSLRMETDGLILPSEELPPIQKMGYFIFHNPKHFFKAAMLKVWYLLTGIRPYYSAAHNYYLIAWMAGLYFLSFQGWRKAKRVTIAVFIITVVVVNCGLIAVSTVDWDNRFYIPMEPGIVILAGGGATVVLDWMKRKK
jgi:Dolichyl-phosphate-mannose-protein mannosyltransferase